MTDQVDQQVHTESQDAESVPAGEVTNQTDQTQTLQDEVARAQQRAAEFENKYLRSRADMENYKKRIERTYADLAKSSKKELLKKLLGVEDNLERALHYGQTGQGGEGLMEGVRLTKYQLDQLLEQEGVKPIEAEGKPFNPHLEEALQSVSEPNVPDHTVVQVVRKGYTYQNEVLRPAQVIVSVHPSEEQ